MKTRFLLFLCISLWLTSCGSKRKLVNNKNPGVVIIEPMPQNLPSVEQLEHTRKLKRKNSDLNRYTLMYIRKYAPVAVNEMHQYKIPASITLAQGILESGRGRSDLAKKSNNHFGIKCHAGWEGERVYHDDDEKGECFRKYSYPETSYNDHSLFLTQRRRYAFLFKYDAKDYKKWAYGLRKAGYATDKKYPVKLLKIIKDYKLDEFDDVKKSKFQKEIKKLNKHRKYSKPIIVEKSKKNTYKVKKGDTLYSIGRKYGVPVDVLKKLNGLRNNTISIGQRLLIK